MKIYDEKHIKNVVLLGAQKAGKTLLAEDMIYEAGIIHRRGTIENKNTVSDYHEIEHERGNSIFSTIMHTEWRDYKINLIDTPGLDDFIGEVISSIAVCDTVVMLRAGRVLAQGSTRDVLTAPMIQELYDVEADVRFHAAAGHLTIVPVRRLP